MKLGTDVLYLLFCSKHQEPEVSTELSTLIGTAILHLEIEKTLGPFEKDISYIVNEDEEHSNHVEPERVGNK